MPFRVSCPHCNKALNVPDNVEGRKVRCPGCSQPFTASPKVDQDAPTVKANPKPAEVPKAKPRPPADEITEQEPPRKPVRAKSPPREEDDGDEEPTPKSRKPKPKKGGVGLLIAGVVGLFLLVLVGGGGTAAYFLFFNSPTKPNTNNNTHIAKDGQPKDGQPKDGQPKDGQPKDDKDKDAKDKGKEGEKDKDVKDKGKQPSKPKFATPEEVFAVYAKSREKDDELGYVSTLAPETQADLAAFMMALFATGPRPPKPNEKDKKLFAILDQHGLTPEATKEAAAIIDKGGFKEMKRGCEMLKKLIKDPAALLSAIENEMKDESKKSTSSTTKRLEGAVKIDKDQATGTVVTTTIDKRGKSTTKKRPIRFVRIEGSWLILNDGDLIFFEENNVEPEDDATPSVPWKPSAKLGAKAGKWVLEEVKLGTRMITDRDVYFLTAVPKEMAGGTFVKRPSTEYGSWLPDGSLEAIEEGTVYAIIRTSLGGKETFGPQAQQQLMEDGWDPVSEAVATTEPKGEKWVWKAFVTSVKQGPINLKLKMLDWSKNGTGILFVVRGKSAVGTPITPTTPPRRPIVRKGPVFATPQACAEAFLAAARKGDHRSMWNCVEDSVLHRMAGELALNGLDKFGTLELNQDKKERHDRLVKESKPYFDVMAKHGLTEESTMKYRLRRPTEAQVERSLVGLSAMIEDPLAFIVDWYTVEQKTKGTQYRQEVEEVTDVKIDGNRARAFVVRTDSNDDKWRRPLDFVKEGGGWRITFSPTNEKLREEPVKRSDDEEAAIKAAASAGGTRRKMVEDLEKAVMGFYFSEADFKSGGLKGVRPVLEKVQGGVGLSFDFNKKVTDEDVLALKGMKNLKALLLGKNKTTSACLETIATLENLESLQLSNDSITDEDVKKIAGLTKLRRLDISSTKLTSACLPALAKLTNLRRFRLCEIQSDGDLERINGWTELRELKISADFSGKEKVTDVGLAHVAKFTELREFQLLRCSNVSDKGLLFLSKMQKLEVVTFTSGSITDESLDTLKAMPSLRGLEILFCRKITADAVKKFQADRPKVNVTFQ